MNINPYRFTGQGLLHLHDYSTGIGGLGIRKEEALPLLEANQRQMSLLQDRLYAENKESVLIIFPRTIPLILTFLPLRIAALTLLPFMARDLC